MNTNEPNVARPTVEFLPTGNGTIHALACLDVLPGGMILHAHEEWGKNEHTITLERHGLQVKFGLSLFQLDCLVLSLAQFTKAVRDVRGYQVAQPIGNPVPRIHVEGEPE